VRHSGAVAPDHSVARLGRRALDPGDGARWWQRAPAFVLWGGAWTLLYLVAYVVLSGPLGDQVANAVSMVATTVGSTASHRFFTYTVRDHSVRRITVHQLVGLALLGVGLGLTAGSLWALARLDPGAPAAVELVVLLAANAVSGTLRFLVLHLVMRPPTDAGADHTPRGTVEA
jgi:putative flippase GtrA